jgi:hypothetical protein
MMRNTRSLPIIDPKSIYKESKAKGDVDTLVKYEDIEEFAK